MRCEGCGCLPPPRGLRGAWCEWGATMSFECVQARGVDASLLRRGPLIFRGGGGGACPCCRLLGGNHFVVTLATTVAHTLPGGHASQAWRQVVLRASLKHRQSCHVPWHVVPHRAACFCCSMESTTGETWWARVLRTGACSLRWCARTVCLGLQFAFDGGVRGLWDFLVPHDRKKVFGKGAAGATFRHGVCIHCWHEACV